MKRKLMLMLVVLAVFTSCQKYELSDPLDLSTLPTVTVKGTLYADLNLTNSTLEYIPEGLRVTVSVPYADYDANNSSSGNHIITTTIDNKGSFSVNIPVISSGVTATVSFESFVYDVIMGIGEDTIRETMQFSLPPKTINGLGQGNSAETVKLLENYGIESTDPNIGTFTPTTKVKYEGTLLYLKEYKNYTVITPTDTVTRDTNIYAPVPAGVTLTVEINSVDEFGRDFYQVKKVKTTSSGGYSIEIPVASKGYADIEITSEEIWQYEDRILGKAYLYNYKLEAAKKVYFVDYKNQEYKYVKGDLIYEIE